MRLFALQIGLLGLVVGAGVAAASLPSEQDDGMDRMANAMADVTGTDFGFLMQMAILAPAQPGEDCFNVEFVQGYAPVDRDTIRLDLGNRRAFEVDLSGPQCDQLAWTQRLALESTPGSWICAGNRPGQGEIHFRDPTTRRRLTCHIEAVRRLPEQPARH